MRNDNKQLCKKCKYAGTASTFKFGSPGGKKLPNESAVICDFIGHTGRSRMLICDAEDCTVYEPRTRKRGTIPRSTKR